MPLAFPAGMNTRCEMTPFRATSYRSLLMTGTLILIAGACGPRTRPPHPVATLSNPDGSATEVLEREDLTMAAVSIFFVAVAALVFGLIARFGDLPRLLGAWSADERE